MYQKNLNLELDLSIVQLIISNVFFLCVDSLELKTVKLTNKDLKVVLKNTFQNPSERSITPDDFPLIGETIFRLTDTTSVKSPERTITIGFGHKPPSDDVRIQKGYLTSVKKSLQSFLQTVVRIGVKKDQRVQKQTIVLLSVQTKLL